jgi:hypothetical protein
MRNAGKNETDSLPEFLFSRFIVCLEFKTKSHAREIAWPTSLPSAALPASGSRGSIDVLAPIISARRLPRTYFSVRIRRRDKSARGLALRPTVIDRRYRRCRSNEASIATSLLPAVLCWYERSGAIRRSSFATATQRCNCPRRLARPRCLPPLPCRSRAQCPHQS